MEPRVVGDRYQLGEILAEGRTTTLYAAVDLRLRRPVALRMLNPELARDADLVQRFLDDARRAATSVHTDIATTLDAGMDGEVPYAVAELTEGKAYPDLLGGGTGWRNRRGATGAAPTPARRARRDGATPGWVGVLLPTVFLALVLVGAVFTAVFYRPRIELPDVAGFVAGDAEGDRAARVALTQARDLERAISAVRSNTQRVNSLLNTARERLAAVDSTVEGMRTLLEEMKRDAVEGAADPARVAGLAAKRQSLELSYSSLQNARSGFQAAATELETRLGAMDADAARAGEAAGRLRVTLDESMVQTNLEPQPGDELAAIADYMAAAGSARREIRSMREADASLIDAASALLAQGSQPPSVAASPQQQGQTQVGGPPPARTAPSGQDGEPPARATPTPIPAGTPRGQFQIARWARPLADQIPQWVGIPVESERVEASTGDRLQNTTGGLLVRRNATDLVYFTDGHMTWVQSPFGLLSRPNGELFDWERTTSQDPGE